LVAKLSGARGVDVADLLASHLPAATPDNPEVHEGKAWNDFHQARAKQDKLEGKKTSDENRVSKPDEQLAAAKTERDQVAEDLTKATDGGDVDMDPHAKKHIEDAERLVAQARAKRQEARDYKEDKTARQVKDINYSWAEAVVQGSGKGADSSTSARG